MINPLIAICHASFAPERRASLRTLLEQLDDEGDGIPLIVISDPDRSGSLDCWKRAMFAGLETDATHIVSLPDDVTLSKGFGKALRRFIAEQPDQVFDCAISNIAVHDAERNPKGQLVVSGGWLTSPDGYNGCAGVMPRALLREHLEWRSRCIGWARKGREGYVANDLGVDFWAIATGRRIWKTGVSLVDHNTDMPSLDGNDADDFRKPLNFVADARELGGWDAAPVDLPKTFTGNHWLPVFNPDLVLDWNVERSYDAERGGPVSDTPFVFIAMPAYVCPELAVRASVQRVIQDLEAHSIKAMVFETPGDSLVTRGRHCLQHAFLASPATHFLQWDADVEMLDATAVRKMFESGHDIVGCAYPWRDGSGRVVCNALQSSFEEQHVNIDSHQCIKVAELGTGFLMVSRTCIIDLIKTHPDELYQADIEPYAGCPMWALFDARIETMPGGRRRYASEDWRFCTLAREAGYSVNLYYPPMMRHWGKKAHDGHVTKAWGFGCELVTQGAP